MCVVLLLCKQLVGIELPVSQAVVVVVASISSSVDPWQAAQGQWGGGSCPAAVLISQWPSHLCSREGTNCTR